MPKSGIVFDHTHIISTDPQAAASWYVDKLGGEIVRSNEMKGAPQIIVSFGEVTVIVRGQRTSERVGKKGEPQWGADHFGFLVRDDFDGFCGNLKNKGVRFTMEPTDINPTTRIAFIEAPDGVSIELVHRAD